MKFIEYTTKLKVILDKLRSNELSRDERQGLLDDAEEVVQEAEAYAQSLEQPPIVQLRLFRDEMERMIQEFDEFERRHGTEGPEE